MRIPAHNWETQQLDYTEYPDGLFEPLIVWLLTTSAWYDDPQRVRDKILLLKRQLADYRNPSETHHEADAPPTKRAKQLANLAKARAARKAKREAVPA